MKNPRRLTGLPEGALDVDKRDISFDLATADGTLSFVARYGVASQIISALAGLLSGMREALLAQGKTFEPLAPESLQGAHIVKDRWSDTVLLVLVATSGVETAYKIPARIAAHIADRLKSESAKPTEIGQA